jgi:hypothetical protein
MIAFARGARTGLLMIWMPALWNTASKTGHEFAVPVSDEELDLLGTVVEVHQEIPDLLGHPRCGRLVSDAQDVDAAGRMFDDSQAAHLRADEQADGEEVSGDDRFGLNSQKLCPTRPGRPRREIDPGSGEDLPHRRGADPDAEAGELAVNRISASFQDDPCQPTAST